MEYQRTICFILSDKLMAPSYDDHFKLVLSTQVVAVANLQLGIIFSVRWTQQNCSRATPNVNSVGHCMLITIYCLSIFGSDLSNPTPFLLATTWHDMTETSKASSSWSQKMATMNVSISGKGHLNSPACLTSEMPNILLIGHPEIVENSITNSVYMG